MDSRTALRLHALTFILTTAAALQFNSAHARHEHVMINGSPGSMNCDTVTAPLDYASAYNSRFMYEPLQVRVARCSPPLAATIPY